MDLMIRLKEEKQELVKIMEGHNFDDEDSNETV